MNSYKVEFRTSNGVRTYEIVKARDMSDAKKLIEAKYGKVTFYNVTRVQLLYRSKQVAPRY